MLTSTSTAFKVANAEENRAMGTGARENDNAHIFREEGGEATTR